MKDVFQQFGFTNRHAASASEAGRAVVPGHDVQVYETDAFLVKTVGDYLIEGARLGQPIVVIATTLHMRQFADYLARFGTNPDELVAGRDAVWLDANEALAAFMERGRPNHELFDATIGSVFERLTASRPYAVVRTYGEMVDLLWRSGRAESALEVERMWNDLLGRYRFALLCTYSMESLRAENDQALVHKMHAHHARVLPAEGLPGPPPT